MAAWWQHAGRMARHLWRGDALPHGLRAGVLDRLTERVAESETRHSGQIRLCIEGSLPLSYLWRGASPRERALTLFGKLGVWDTEHNNGVLIYLLLAEHAIEVVADRGLARRVPQSAWGTLVAEMGDTLRNGETERALNQALAEVSALLEQHFPGASATGNELPDSPVFAPRSL